MDYAKCYDISDFRDRLEDLSVRTIFLSPYTILSFLLMRDNWLITIPISSIYTAIEWNKAKCLDMQISSENG